MRLLRNRKFVGLLVGGMAIAVNNPHAENLAVTTWKPDFTNPNPYEGMPPEYATQVSQTFAPTKEELTKIDHWKQQRRGDPIKAYNARGKRSCI